MKADPQDIVCGKCHEEHATIHVTEVVDGELRQSHFCTGCWARGPAGRGV